MAIKKKVNHFSDKEWTTVGVKIGAVQRGTGSSG